MGVPYGFNGPTGSQETIIVKHTPPRNASNPPKLCQEPTSPYGSLVGVVEDRSVLIGFLGVIIRQPIA